VGKKSLPGTILISGGTMGLGNSISKHFVTKGLDVVICSRSPKDIEESRRNLERISNANQQILGIVCDVSSEESVFNLWNSLEKREIRISTLICNAGVVGPIGNFLDIKKNEWEISTSINLFGVANLIRVFLPSMIDVGIGRVIHISGGGATKALMAMSSYATSKTAAVRLIETLAIEYEGSGVTFNSVAPGIIKSRILDDMLAAGEKVIGKDLHNRGIERKLSTMDSTTFTINLIEFLSTHDSQGINGKLISAEWDDWRSWVKHKDLLRESDVYTLRRIIGRDRGQNWGDKF
jgi:NAD(P)-dependent dehydrogenase (short-subunit alcohol dehydrogenase family)